MRKTIIKSNWINLLSLAVYIGLLTTIDGVTKDYADKNILVNLIGNIAMGAFYGLLFPIGWGLPVTLLFLIVLVTTDMVIIKPMNLSLLSFALQTLVLATVLTILVFAFDLDRIHYFFLLFFITGQYYRYRLMLRAAANSNFAQNGGHTRA